MCLETNLRDLWPTWTVRLSESEISFILVKIEPFKKWNINNLQSEQRRRKCRAPWGVWGLCCRSGKWYMILLCDLSSPTPSSLCFLFFISRRRGERRLAKLTDGCSVYDKNLGLKLRVMSRVWQKMKSEPLPFPSPTHLGYLCIAKFWSVIVTGSSHLQRRKT